MEIYSLRAEFVSYRENETIDKVLFERTLYLRFLRETGHNSSSYDPELKMHFQNSNAVASLYEIEIADFFVTASQRLKKAEEFIRRLNYKYDWAQIRVNHSGKGLLIENKNELKERWERLKNAMLKDYKGSVVEHALTNTDIIFESDELINNSLYQYFYFALLFLNIPKKHSENWINTRLIEFSEYEKEKFSETITYVKTEDDFRIYNITGVAVPESKTVVTNYKGRANIKKETILPDKAELKIQFLRDEISNQWSFKLLRVNN